MKLAVISDLHGNAVALRAFQQDIRDRNISQVICLGDTVSLGPEPAETLQLLRDLKAKCILGNHDEYMIRPELVEQYTQLPFLIAAEDWCRERLSQVDLSFISSFKDKLEIKWAGVTVTLFHASPSSNSDDIMPESSPERLDEQLKGVSGDVLVYGHTHLQGVRQHRGRWLVNPGSLGMPFQEHATRGEPQLLPFAEYAIIDLASPSGPEIILRRLKLEKEKLLEPVRRELTFPMRDYLLEQWGK